MEGAQMKGRLWDGGREFVTCNRVQGKQSLSLSLTMSGEGVHAFIQVQHVCKLLIFLILGGSAIATAENRCTLTYLY